MLYGGPKGTDRGIKVVCCSSYRAYLVYIEATNGYVYC